MTKLSNPLIVVVPAAGVGKRMKAACPKQYLTIDRYSVLEHTVNRLLTHSAIEKVILAIGENDEYFAQSSLVNHPQVQTVIGGKERVDSVLAGLQAIDDKAYPWVLVHDAARPCVTHQDIDALVQACIEKNHGGLLAAPVRDTMKRSDASQCVTQTVERENLWHALTPQMYKTKELFIAMNKAINEGADITDESSAIEYVKLPSLLVESSSDNLKITRPDDLALATFILAKQKETLCV